MALSDVWSELAACAVCVQRQQLELQWKLLFEINWKTEREIFDLSLRKWLKNIDNFNVMEIIFYKVNFFLSFPIIKLSLVLSSSNHHLSSPPLFPGKPANRANVHVRRMPFTNNRRRMCTSDLASRWFRRQIRAWSREIWAIRGCRQACVSRRAWIATLTSCRMRRCHGWAARERDCASSRSPISCPSRISRWSTVGIWRCSMRHRSRTLWRHAMKLHWI